MFKLNLVSGVLLSAFISISVSSCGLKTKTVEPYTIAIDSISAPDTVKIKTVFEIQIFGYVGPSKCYAFDKAYIYPNTNASNELIIEAWGIYTYSGTPCTDDPQYLSTTVETSLSVTGTYLLKGIKSGYDYAEKRVVVIL